MNPARRTMLKTIAKRILLEGCFLSLVAWAWFIGKGLRAQGSRLKAQGSRLKAQGSRSKAQGARGKAQGARGKGQDTRLKEQGKAYG